MAIKVLIRDNEKPGELVEKALPIDIGQDDTLDFAMHINLAPTKSYGVNNKKVLGERVTGLGPALTAHTFTQTITPEDVIALNTLHAKMIAIETALLAHGMVAE